MQVSKQSNSLVVMPTAKRPEMLALALRRLSLALNQSLNKPPVLVCLDHLEGHSTLAEVEYVIAHYLPTANLKVASPHILAPSGCWNILNAIKIGSEAAESVYLVEEDVMVYPRFFEWHEAQEGCVVSCGRHDKSFRWGEYYTNPGSCLWRPLLDALMPHVNDDYFKDPSLYIAQHFPPWEVPSVLDDGLIRRVMRQECWLPVYPEHPVCAHQGWRWFGKCDIYGCRGTIQERIVRLEELIAGIKPTDRYAWDFEPFAPEQAASLL